MMAITRSAWMTPSSMSLVSSEASETEWIGTLRTSMAEGCVGMGPIQADRHSVRYDDRSRGPEVGHRVDDAVEAGDHARQAGALHEPAHGVHLRTHRPAREVPLRGVLLHLRERHPPEGFGVGRPEAEHRLR